MTTKFGVAVLLLIGVLGIAAPAEAQQVSCETTRPFTYIKHRTWDMDYQLAMQTVWLGTWDANGNWVLNHNAYAQPDSPFEATVLGSVWGGAQNQVVDPPFTWFDYGPLNYGTNTADRAAECSAACETIPGTDFCLSSPWGSCTGLKYRPGVNPNSFTYHPSPPSYQHGSGYYDLYGGYGVSTCVPAPNRPDMTAGTITPVVANAGTPTTYSTTITSTLLPAGASQTRFQWSVDGWVTTNIGDVATPAIAANASAAVSISHTFATQGTYYMRACADATLAVDESNDLNNCSGWVPVTVGAASLADLTAGGISPDTAWLGQTKTLSGTVTNLGGVPAGASSSYFQVTAPNSKDNTSSTVGTPVIAIGSGSLASFSYKFNYLGNYSARLCADWFGVVPEGNEGNNCGPWTDISVNEPPVSSSVSCSVDKTSVLSGESVIYTALPVAGATSPYTWLGSDGASGFGTNETAVRTFTTPGTYGMQVSATGATSPAQCPFVSVAACPGTRTANIDAVPARVNAGGTVTLNWQASAINSRCTITGPTGTLYTSNATSCNVPDGTITATVTAQSTYTISCDNGAITDSVIVNVVPKIKEF